MVGFPEINRRQALRFVLHSFGIAVTGSILHACSPEEQTTEVPALTSQPTVALETPTILPTSTAVNSTLTLEVKAIHMASESQDVQQHSESQIEDIVAAVVESMPALTHIAISTYLDYSGEIQKWVEATHRNGKRVMVRPPGFNNWLGTFGLEANGTLEQHQMRTVEFLQRNKGMFLPGDWFEVVPDELENNKRLFPDGRINEANAFIRQTFDMVAPILDGTGVEYRYVFTNPSMTADIISTETAKSLVVMGTDNYPRVQVANLADYPQEYAQALSDEVSRWAVQSKHGDRPWHFTIGPLVQENIDDEEIQAEAYRLALPALVDAVPNIQGITVWPFGSRGNEFRYRLFDDTHSGWKPRRAVEVINNFFATH